MNNSLVRKEAEEIKGMILLLCAVFGCHPENIGNLRAIQESVNESLGQLNTEENFVLRKRFGLTDGGMEYNLREIGEQLRMTPQAVRQIETKALKKMRRIFPLGMVRNERNKKCLK